MLRESSSVPQRMIDEINALEFQPGEHVSQPLEQASPPPVVLPKKGEVFDRRKFLGKRIRDAGGFLMTAGTGGLLGSTFDQQRTERTLPGKEALSAATAAGVGFLVYSAGELILDSQPENKP